MKYAKRDSLFEALRITADNQEEVLKFTHGKTPRAVTGDWVIRWGGTKIFTMPPGQFHATFVQTTDT